MIKAAVIGDSVSRGVVLDAQKERYVMQKDDVATRLARKLGIEVKNFSRFGCTVQKGYEYLLKSVDKWKDCQYAVLEFGGNDSNFDWVQIAQRPDDEHVPGTPLSLFEEIYTRMLREIAAQGVRAVAMTLPPVESMSFFDWVTRAGLNRENVLKWLGGDKHYIYRWHERYNAAILRAVAATGSGLIDIRQAFLEERRLDTLMCLDGMHPNERGYDCMENAIASYAQGKLAPVM